MTTQREQDSESETASLPKSLWLFRTPYRYGRRAYRIIQAATGALISALAIFLQAYGVTDVVAYVRSVFADSEKVAYIVAGTAITFVLLKAILSGPKGFSAPRDLNDGE